MGYTNETTHYSIPLPLGSDKTTPMDYNQSAQEVDTVLFEAKTDSASALQKANQLQQDLSTTNNNVTGVTGRVTTLEGTVTTQGGAIIQNTQDIADVRADALDMIVAKDEGTAQVATIAVTTGEYFRYNDVLYIATQDISVGDTIVPNTNCRATNVGTELNQLNASLADIETSYNTLDVLAQSATGVITLDKSLYDYATIRFENSNFGIREVNLSDNQTVLRLDTVSMSGSICVICIEEWTISNNGKTLTPRYKVQINIESTGVTLFDTSASFTWNIWGLKQAE